jgi:hypothetical protein
MTTDKSPFPVEFCDICGRPVAFIVFHDTPEPVMNSDAVPHICWYGVTICMECNQMKYPVFDVSNFMDCADESLPYSKS